MRPRGQQPRGDARSAALLALIAAACGRIGFNGRDDAAKPAPCAWTAFQPPVRLPPPLNSTFDDWFPTPRGDAELYFHSYRTGSLGAALWVARRASTGDGFDPPTRMDQLDTVDDEVAPTITDDGLELVFERDSGSGVAHLYSSRRGSSDVPFVDASQLMLGDSNAVDTTPWLSGDGLRLIFSSARSGGIGALDLYETSRADRSGDWALPKPLIELDDIANDASPTLSVDGLDIYYSSIRTGTLNEYDVFTAHRSALDQPFEAPHRVTELESDLDEFGLRLTADGTSLFLNYDALTRGGVDADMWTARRSCL